MSMYDRFFNSALYSEVSMFPRFKIMARKADGTEFDCFTWTRDEASGIRRAWSDAEKFGIEIVDAWAVAGDKSVMTQGERLRFIRTGKAR